MDESQAYQVLVIILSITLAIFLVLAIVATTWLIKVLKHVNSIIEKADKVASNLEAAADNFKSVSGPAAVIKAAMNVFKR